MSKAHRDLEHFYELMQLLRQTCGGERRLNESHGRMNWPQRGVYFFFEDGEQRADGTPRVVRVGTHGLMDGSSSTLWKRLSQHRGNVGGRSAGGGNHRGSIFRSHVGSALANKSGSWAPLFPGWEIRGNASREIRTSELGLEVAVSKYIGNMPFLWLDVDDLPSRASDRGIIEAGSIALLSACVNPAADEPSEDWLGKYSARDVINKSGLWNVRHVNDTYDPAFLEVLERRISQMRG